MNSLFKQLLEKERQQLEITYKEKYENFIKQKEEEYSKKELALNLKFEQSLELILQQHAEQLLNLEKEKSNLESHLKLEISNLKIKILQQVNEKQILLKEKEETIHSLENYLLKLQ